MTCDLIGEDRWRLTFAEAEAAFLMNVLARLARHYGEDLAGASPRLRNFWQGGASIPAAGPRASDDPEAEGAREMLAESRAELRSERLARAESWLRDFELAEDPWTFDMTPAERDEFAAMLNDRRLILAIESGVMQDDNAPSTRGKMEERRDAIMEIDVLGHFIMMLLGPQIYRP